jgi:hypothetical protein
VETRLAGVEARLTFVEQNLADLKAEFREFRREVTERLDATNRLLVSQARWNIGLLGLFGTIFAILYGIGQLRP